MQKNKFKGSKAGGDEATCKQTDHVMKIHMISETALVAKGQGVDTAFISLVQLLREKNDVG